MIDAPTMPTDVAGVMTLMRSQFAAKHIGLAWTLVGMAPRAGNHRTQLTSSAYQKGLRAGIVFDRINEPEPPCPYQRWHGAANFAGGDYDPRAAWIEGLSDGERIRMIILHPGSTIVPMLRCREFCALTEDLKPEWRLMIETDEYPHAMASADNMASLATAPNLETVDGSRPLMSCTGIAARWCPVHGDCTNRETLEDEDDFGSRYSDHCSDAACPLHGAHSTHAEMFR